MNEYPTKLYSILALAIVLCTLCSCSFHDDMEDCTRTNYIKVTFDWDRYPEANPASMMLFLYPKTEGESTIQREFVGKDGGVVKAPAGVEYSLLAFNSDPQNTYFTKLENQNSYEVTSVDATTVGPVGLSASAIPRAEGTESERMSAEADSVYAATGETTLLGTRATGNDDTIYVTLSPQPMFHTYRVYVHGVRNSQNLSSTIAGSISGLTGGVNLATGKRISENVTIPFFAHLANDSTLTGQFLCYGKGETEIKHNRLMVYTELKDGTKWKYDSNVTNQVTESVSEDVEVNVGQLPVPDKIDNNNGGGFKPNVDDWSNIDIPTDM